MIANVRPEEATASKDGASLKRESKHWLEYLIFAFVVFTTIATGFAAWYTRQQWLTAADTEKRQVRAYAFPTPTGIKNFEVGKAPTSGISVRTMGQTPAYKIRGQIGIAGRPYPLDYERLPPTTNPNQAQNSTFISPTNVFSLQVIAASTLNQLTMNAIETGNDFRLYVWGRVDYEDVFEDPHWFTFCYSYDGTNIREGDGGEPCLQHNDDDHKHMKSP